MLGIELLHSNSIRASFHDTRVNLNFVQIEYLFNSLSEDTAHDLSFGHTQKHGEHSLSLPRTHRVAQVMVNQCLNVFHLYGNIYIRESMATIKHHITTGVH